ncbi:MAG TPA: M28 family peptidase [Granulicella sp.]
MMRQFMGGSRRISALIALSMVLWLSAAPSLSAQLPIKIPGLGKKKKEDKKPAAPAPWVVKPEWISAHEDFLAGDALNGRGSATRDEELAANYVVSKFTSYGLTAAPGMNGNMQAIDVVAPTLDGKATLSAGDVLLVEGDDMQILYSLGATAVGTLQRMPASEVGKTAVQRNAVVLVTDVPKDAAPVQLFGKLRDAGAVLVMMQKGDATQKYFDRYGDKTHVPVLLKDDPNPPAPATLVAISDAAAKGLDTVREGSPVTLAVHSEVKPRQTFNAIGFLAGTDPTAGTILLTAHLDHLGTGTPVNGDAIYNGANDDASGTTAVLELAHALGSGPKLKRSILFVCYGSEEIGELGSEYFGKHSPVPLNNFVANLEFEMIGNQDPKMPPGTLMFTGYDRSNLGSTLKEHGAKLGPDPYPDQRFFERSDNYQLALEGIVAHTASGWAMPPTYHQPDDDIAHLDINFMTTAIQSLIDPVRWLANNDFKPAWFPGQQPHR